MGLFSRIASDVRYLTGVLRSLRRVSAVARNPNVTYPDIIETQASRHGERMALLGEGEEFTYARFNARANQYARWAQANGVGKGDSVALLMNNRPEFLVVWLGVARAGGVCALINTHLTGPGLAHCINIASPKHIIADAGLLPALETARAHLKSEAKTWVSGSPRERHADIAVAVEEQSGAPLAGPERVALTTRDPCLFIYTSGTTGLPKAANINHYRVMAIMNGFSGVMNARAEDRIYVTLPLYHTAGGVLATGAVLTVGGSVAIRESFSASEFWSDIVRYECTLFQYIGEMCRYLLNSPEHPDERRHKIRLCCGNGLRPDIWVPFRDRFGIPAIREFYASTEGNVALINFDGKPGAVGRIPWYLRRKLVTEVIRFDFEAEMPVRDQSGFCVPADDDEIGEVVGKIVNDPSQPAQRFEGYADQQETAKKVLQDVFEPGDRWFRTGDLMRRDALGYFYFVDRVGDTFRWKGENVATSEVAETIHVFPGVEEANVYGVEVPGHEGRAGMVLLNVDEDFVLDEFYGHLARRLPEYARPLFVRISGERDVTSTFKQKKVDLVKAGFDPDQVSDRLYFNDPGAGAFRVLDRGLYGEICAGGIRL